LDHGYAVEDAPFERKDMPVWMPDWLSQHTALDLAVVVSFGYLIPPSVLSRFRYGGINVHPSLLPKYRGPAPIENTILNGEKETGVSIIGLHPTRFDAGNVLAQSKINIPNPDQIKYLELHEILERNASNLLYDTLKDFENYAKSSHLQDEGQVTKAPKVKRELGFIDWNNTSALQVDRIHRAISHRVSL
jgi:methionyl-tRNA formyltransferase